MPKNSYIQDKNSYTYTCYECGYIFNSKTPKSSKLAQRLHNKNQHSGHTKSTDYYETETKTRSKRGNNCMDKKLVKVNKNGEHDAELRDKIREEFESGFNSKPNGVLMKNKKPIYNRGVEGVITKFARQRDYDNKNACNRR